MVSCVCEDLRQSQNMNRDSSEHSVLTHAEVLDGLPGVPLSPQEDRIRPGRCPQGKLIEGQDLTTGFEDTLLSGLGETESSNAEFGDLE